MGRPQGSAVALPPAPDGYRPAGDWRYDGLCQAEPHYWHAHDGEDKHDRTRREAIAKLRCARCLVLEECTAWVLGQKHDPCADSVVAGLAPAERRQARVDEESGQQRLWLR